MKTHSITNKEFLETELKMGVGFHNDGYINLMRNALKTTLAITGDMDIFVDLGAGTGVLAAVASQMIPKVQAMDTNPEHKKYFKEHAAKKIPTAEAVDFCDCDFTRKRFNFQDKRTLLACIEVAEHIPQPDYEKFLQNVEDRADWFLFSSTYKRNPANDEKWGHINIHETAEWVEIHERFGWTLARRLTAPTKWTLLFKISKA